MIDINDLPDDIPEELKKLISNSNVVVSGIINKRKTNSIAAHYGITDEKYESWMREMACDMINISEKSKILDKWFTPQDTLNETRLKVLAYNAANELFKN